MNYNYLTISPHAGINRIFPEHKIVGKDITQTDFFEMLEAVGATETRSLPQIVMIGEDNLAFYVGAGQKGLIELAKMLK